MYWTVPFQRPGHGAPPAIQLLYKIRSNLDTAEETQLPIDQLHNHCWLMCGAVVAWQAKHYVGMEWPNGIKKGKRH